MQIHLIHLSQRLARRLTVGNWFLKRAMMIPHVQDATVQIPHLADLDRQCLNLNRHASMTMTRAIPTKHKPRSDRRRPARRRNSSDLFDIAIIYHPWLRPPQHRAEKISTWTKAHRSALPDRRLPLPNGRSLVTLLLGQPRNWLALSVTTRSMPTRIWDPEQRNRLDGSFPHIQRQRIEFTERKKVQRESIGPMTTWRTVPENSLSPRLQPVASVRTRVRKTNWTARNQAPMSKNVIYHRDHVLIERRTTMKTTLPVVEEPHPPLVDWSVQVTHPRDHIHARLKISMMTFHESQHRCSFIVQRAVSVHFLTLSPCIAVGSASWCLTAIKRLCSDRCWFQLNRTDGFLCGLNQ